MGKIRFYFSKKKEFYVVGSSDCRLEGVSQWLAEAAVHVCHSEFLQGCVQGSFLNAASC